MRTKLANRLAAWIVKHWGVVDASVVLSKEVLEGSPKLNEYRKAVRWLGRFDPPGPSQGI